MITCYTLQYKWPSWYYNAPRYVLIDQLTLESNSKVKRTEKEKISTRKKEKTHWKISDLFYKFYRLFFIFFLEHNKIVIEIQMFEHVPFEMNRKSFETLILYWDLHIFVIWIYVWMLFLYGYKIKVYLNQKKKMFCHVSAGWKSFKYTIYTADRASDISKNGYKKEVLDTR